MSRPPYSIVALAALAVLLPHAADALVLRAEANWSQMQITFDPGVSYLGQTDYNHYVTLDILSELSQGQNTRDPFLALDKQYAVPAEVQLTAQGGILPAGSRRDSISVTDIQPGQYNSYMANEFLEGDVVIDGEGWVHITVPYHLAYTGPLDVEGGLLEPTTAFAGTGVLMYITTPQGNYLDYEHRGLSILDFGSGSGQETGLIDLSFYNSGRNTYSYAATVRTSAWLFPVPEPETWALLGTGALMLLARQRLRRSRA